MLLPCLHPSPPTRYDPVHDVRVNEDGIIEWDSEKPRLHRQLTEYFNNRKEGPKPNNTDDHDGDAWAAQVRPRSRHPNGAWHVWHARPGRLTFPPAPDMGTRRTQRAAHLAPQTPRLKRHASRRRALWPARPSHTSHLLAQRNAASA